MKTYFYTYVYDEAGQLVRENLLEDDKTILYVYDIGGNIVSKTEYEYTLGEITENMSPEKASNYTYGDDEYKDLLTGYTFTESSTTVNSELTYDAIGNVTSFNGNTFTWTAGRQLESSTTEENQLIKYFYNENGFLTRMDMYEDGGVTYSGSMAYIWDGDRLVSRSFLDLQSGQNITVRIIYDVVGDNVGIVISNLANGDSSGEMTLLYRKNLQGDITGLIDSSTGQLIAAYTYDAYGTPSLQPVNDNQLSVIASFLFMVITPQLYRGYIYSIVGDEVCYYLGSRFYSPKLGRFLNADKHFDTGTGVLGTNMFAYCNNNPVMYTDPTGEAGVGILIGGTSATVIMYALAATGIVMLALSATGIHVTFAEVLSAAIDYLAGQAKLSAFKIKAYANMIVATVTATYTANKLTGIAGDYGLYKCKEAEKAMADYLLKKGIDAKVIHLKYINSIGYIFSEKLQTNISENGNHYGIYYNGIVFCNVHPEGLSLNNWLSDFYSTGTQTYHYHNLNWTWRC